MNELANQSGPQFIDGFRPEVVLSLRPETGHDVVVVSGVADIDQRSPKWQLRRGQLHSLPNGPFSSVEVAGHYEVALQCVGDFGDTLDHARDVLLSDRPFEVGRRVTIERNTADDSQSLSTKDDGFRHWRPLGSHRQVPKLAPVADGIGQDVAGTVLGFGEVLDAYELSCPRDVIEECLLTHAVADSVVWPEGSPNLVGVLRSVIVQCEVRHESPQWIGRVATNGIDTKWSHDGDSEYRVVGGIDSWFWSSNGCACRSRRPGSLWIRCRLLDRFWESAASTSPDLHRDVRNENQGEELSNVMEEARPHRSGRWSRRWCSGRCHRQFLWKGHSKGNRAAGPDQLLGKTFEVRVLSGQHRRTRYHHVASSGREWNCEVISGVEQSIVRVGIRIVLLTNWIGPSRFVMSSRRSDEVNCGCGKRCHVGEAVTFVRRTQWILTGTGLSIQPEVDHAGTSCYPGTVRIASGELRANYRKQCGHRYVTSHTDDGNRNNSADAVAGTLIAHRAAGRRDRARHSRNGNKRDSRRELEEGAAV